MKKKEWEQATTTTCILTTHLLYRYWEYLLLITVSLALLLFLFESQEWELVLVGCSNIRLEVRCSNIRLEVGSGWTHRSECNWGIAITGITLRELSSQSTFSTKIRMELLLTYDHKSRIRISFLRCALLSCIQLRSPIQSCPLGS